MIVKPKGCRLPRVRVLSEVEPHDGIRGGRLDVWNDVGLRRVSRLIEIADTTVPGGGTADVRVRDGDRVPWVRRLPWSPPAPIRTLCRQSRCSAG